MNQHSEDENQFLDLPLDMLAKVRSRQFLFSALIRVRSTYVPCVLGLYVLGTIGHLPSLAQTTQGLRTFLNRHRSCTVWKTAISNVPGLPPCPGHLSEPA